MSKTIPARCLMCGKTCSIEEDHKDYKNLVEQGKELPTFICDLCSYKVRHESEDRNKPQKPI